MCGIAGIVGPSAHKREDMWNAIANMVYAQRHRGPDAEGIARLESALLGHRRLSILDLSDSANQPIPNEDGTVWVVYNGEVYNFWDLRRELSALGHRFLSLSDTEVLVHGYEEWGIEGLLKRLKGMFAFAIYDARSALDARKPKLILARDRFGIKPLYYTVQRDYLIFASEVRAIRHSGLVETEPCPEAWAGFLLFGSVPTPWTTIRGVRALPPGHYLVADGSNITLVQYYDLSSLFVQGPRGTSFPSSASDAQELRAGFRNALTNTVASHLISDAPLGVFLSGGIDSSLLVALASRLKSDLITVGIVFEEEEFTEAKYQTIVAKSFQVQHHALRVTASDFLESLDRFFACLDQPTIDGINTYFVSKAAKDLGLKAVLSGLGGDEVFCGYPTLRRARLFHCIRTLPPLARKCIVGPARALPRTRKLSFLCGGGNLAEYLAQRGLFTPAEVALFLDMEEQEVWKTIRQLETSELPDNPVEKQQYLEFRHYLADQLLRDADVFGMAHSVEIRVPYLDHELVELALSVPLDLRLDSRWPKPLLTKTFSDLLPSEVVFRKKQGFTFPVNLWLRSSKAADYVGSPRNSAITCLWRQFIERRVHWSRPWALIVANVSGVCNGLPSPVV